MAARPPRSVGSSLVLGGGKDATLAPRRGDPSQPNSGRSPQTDARMLETSIITAMTDPSEPPLTVSSALSPRGGGPTKQPAGAAKLPQPLGGDAALAAESSSDEDDPWFSPTVAATPKNSAASATGGAVATLNISSVHSVGIASSAIRRGSDGGFGARGGAAALPSPVASSVPPVAPQPTSHVAEVTKQLDTFFGSIASARGVQGPVVPALMPTNAGGVALRGRRTSAGAPAGADARVVALLTGASAAPPRNVGHSVSPSSAAGLSSGVGATVVPVSELPPLSADAQRRASLLRGGAEGSQGDSVTSGRPSSAAAASTSRTQASALLAEDDDDVAVRQFGDTARSAPAAGGLPLPTTFTFKAEPEDAPSTARAVASVSGTSAAISARGAGVHPATVVPLLFPAARPDADTLRAHLMRPLARSEGLVKGYMVRDRGTFGFASGAPVWRMYSEPDDRFLMASKKRAGNRSSNYFITLDASPATADRKSRDRIAGKLRADWAGSRYVLYDHGAAPRKALPGEALRAELACVFFNYDQLGPGQVRVCIPRVDDAHGTFVEFRPSQTADDIITAAAAGDSTRLTWLRNKKPHPDRITGLPVLNFGGRVKQASVKNFQLVCDETGDKVVLQFGKVSKDRFVFDVAYPLSLLQGFALVMAALDPKMADTPGYEALRSKRSATNMAVAGARPRGDGDGASEDEDDRVVDRVFAHADVPPVPPVSPVSRTATVVPTMTTTADGVEILAPATSRAPSTAATMAATGSSGTSSATTVNVTSVRRSSNLAVSTASPAVTSGSARETTVVDGGDGMPSRVIAAVAPSANWVQVLQAVPATDTDMRPATASSIGATAAPGSVASARHTVTPTHTSSTAPAVAGFFTLGSTGAASATTVLPRVTTTPARVHTTALQAAAAAASAATAAAHATPARRTSVGASTAGTVQAGVSADQSADGSGSRRPSVAWEGDAKESKEGEA